MLKRSARTNPCGTSFLSCLVHNCLFFFTVGSANFLHLSFAIFVGEESTVILGGM